MNPKKAVKIALPVIAIIFLIFLFLYTRENFRIKKVEIVSSAFPIKGLYLLNNSNSILVDGKKIAVELLSQNRDILSLTVNRILPDKLIITPVFRVPAAKVYNQGDKYNIIDKEGYNLSILGEIQDLPSIYANGISLTLYSKPDWRIIKSLNYIQRAGEKGIPVDNIRLDQNLDLFIIRLKAGEEVFVPQISSPSVVTDSLQIIVSRFRIEGKIASKIDFTSDKPVVTLRSEDKNYSNK